MSTQTIKQMIDNVKIGETMYKVVVKILKN